MLDPDPARKTYAYDFDGFEGAYQKACAEGKKKVYNARLVLAGYSEAGKTSLATRLLGDQLKATTGSTEGINIHRIESRFNSSEDNVSGGEWKETGQNISDLLKEFDRQIVVTRNASSTDNKRCYSMNEKYDDEQSESSHPREENFKELTSSKEKTRKKHVHIDVDEEFIEKLRAQTDEDQKREEPQNSSGAPFTISLWDLGGQNEFIATHHLFLGAEATALIVMDITKSLKFTLGENRRIGYLNNPLEFLHYWANLFYASAIMQHDNPNVALVLTHKDKIYETTGQKDINKYIHRYKEQILMAVKGKPYEQWITNDSIYVVDNKTGPDSEFLALRNNLLKGLTKQKSWGMSMPVPWLKLKADILQETNNKHIDEEEVIWMAKKYGMITENVVEFLESQTIFGDFVYFPEVPETVITDPQWLVNKCSAIISSKDFIRKRNLSKSISESLETGEVTEDDLRILWGNEQVRFLTKLMQTYDLLVNVDVKKRKYIIPCMLPSDRIEIPQKDLPCKLLVGSFPHLVAKCSKIEGWKLCTKPDELCYTTASFDIEGGGKVELSLSPSGEVRPAITSPTDCKMKLTEDKRFCEDVKQRLFKAMESCRMAVKNDSGKHYLSLCCFQKI